MILVLMLLAILCFCLLFLFFGARYVGPPQDGPPVPQYDDHGDGNER